MSISIREKLKTLGIELPAPTAPVASYVSVTRAGNHLFISGQISKAPNGEVVAGTLGKDCSDEQGTEAARVAAINILAQIAANTDGSLSSVRRILKLRVYIAATQEFEDHSRIANGASDLMVAVFGEAGKHARAALGMSSLPAGAAVEIDAIVELEESKC
ncbi:RidA family protein [Neorhizobium sp. JUb45]|uniref:RidA family protein n=1 Tax=Neorhizobium sp. JUb45 TaxID=2485113 RepID=UPI00105173BE|nr:RidA family protein [Neorhizobium sp. JUb45]TCR00471.1 enamine deaminase RidA (YjgF/YER057c/UK114 family) [Neorhizobium sp. JUb45]